MLTASPIDVGTMVGSYRVHRVLAEGGMAMVYEASHMILPRRVALKVMHAALISHPYAIQRILQEACILEAFAHPGAVRVFECGVLPDRRPWIAMELLGGEPLTTYLARVGPLPAPVLIAMLTSIIDVLAAAHRSGIVHRDLKPENVLVVGPGVDQLRVIDWGIARQPISCARLTMENFTLGTPTYMAPEQAQGLELDGRADVYALGVLAYEAATGAPPFHADNPIELVMKHLYQAPESLLVYRSDLPAPLVALIERMLTKDPSERPTAGAVAAALANLSRTTLAAAPAVAVYEDTSYEDTSSDDASYDELQIDEGLEQVLSIDDFADVEMTIELEVDEPDEPDVDLLIAALDDAGDDARAVEVDEERPGTGHRPRRWTPQHLVATAAPYAVPERAALRGRMLASRGHYDAVSGVIAGTIGGRRRH